MNLSPIIETAAAQWPWVFYGAGLVALIAGAVVKLVEINRSKKR